jgi:glycosyltransferase involved in cell wall biosynthesis
MKVAVVTGIYNEEKHISELIDKVIAQTVKPDEFVIVDDGSTDRTAEIVKNYAKKYPRIKYIRQENAGPAMARNVAWRATDADICVFTDGDCVPNADWLEKLLAPFSDASIGATAGTYRTVNTKSVLARFIGLEIEWKHSKYPRFIDAHGTYNLAVRKEILEKVGGMCEDYPMPSGEDWDMTYKISRFSKIAFVPEAVVGHYHPEKFWPYMKNQVRRGYDRVKLYNDNPANCNSDAYTGKLIKYQVWLSGMFPPSLIFLYPFFRNSFLVPFLIFVFLILTTFPLFIFMIKKDIPAALYSLAIQFLRNLAWFWGMIKGMKKFGFIKIIKGVVASGF